MSPVPYVLTLANANANANAKPQPKGFILNSAGNCQGPRCLALYCIGLVAEASQVSRLEIQLGQNETPDGSPVCAFQKSRLTLNCQIVVGNLQWAKSFSLY